VVELTEPPSLYGQPVAREGSAGEIDDAGMEIEIAVRKYGVPHEFSGCVHRPGAPLPDKVRPQDRRIASTSRDVPLVTIDGEDARDFDDAVYLRTGEGRARQGLALLVAICRREQLRGDGQRDRRRCLRPRHQRVLSAARHSHAAGEAVQRLCSLNPEVERLCMCATC
jgi:ribonuclease R